MKNQYDPKIEIIVDAILHKSNIANVEVQVCNAFDDDRKESVAIIHNVQTNKFGLISVDVVEYPDDLVCFFIFNGKMFDYCRAEGFGKKSMIECFPNQVFKKVSVEELVKYILEFEDK